METRTDGLVIGLTQEVNYSLLGSLIKSLMRSNYASNIGVTYGILCINTYDGSYSASRTNVYYLHIWHISIH
jgi:hypothetical protein